MGLFTPLYKSKNPEKRMKWIKEKAKAQNSRHLKILIQLVNDHDIVFTQVRMAAIDKIMDQIVLFDIVKHHKSTEIQKASVEKISDQDILIEIAKTKSNDRVRSSAIEKITDQEFLIKIAKNDESSTCRSAAIINLIDQDVLKEIAYNDASEYVRLDAVKKGKIGDNEIVKWLISILFNFYLKAEVYEVLKYLFHNAVLTNESKQLILEHKGRCLTEHHDHEACWSHNDFPAKYFEL